MIKAHRTGLNKLKMGDGSESPNPQIHGSEQLDIHSNHVKNIHVFNIAAVL